MLSMVFSNLLAWQGPLNQVFTPHDLVVVGLLVLLEGVLSIDNALVLGLMARRLPKHQQSKALTYGLLGAFVFRLLAIGLATYLLRWWVVKLLGGGYLVYIALKHLKQLLTEGPADTAGITIGKDGKPIIADSLVGEVPGKPGMHFWSTVLLIEITDIAFAIDSILAAIALVAAGVVPTDGLHPKLWVIVTGGMLGVALMRFAAMVFIRLLEKFPRFETAAYLLVALIGLKLLADWYFNKPPQDHPPGDPFHPPIDFHSYQSLFFWIFWISMLLCFLVGFLPARKSKVVSNW